MSFTPFGQTPEQETAMYDQPEETPTPTRAPRTTKKAVADLFASLEPAPPVAKSAAEKERERRVAMLEKNVVVFSKELMGLGILDGDVEQSAKIAKALGTIKAAATKAILAITDARLGLDPEPSTPKLRAARKPKEDVDAGLDAALAKAKTEAEDPDPVEEEEPQNAPEPEDEDGSGF